jgi:DNA-binding PucR family transcriptional regulator
VSRRAAIETANRVREILAEDAHRRSESDEELESLVRRLLSTSETERRRAVEGCSALGVFEGTPHVTAVVVEPGDSVGLQAPGVRGSLRAASAQSSRRLPEHAAAWADLDGTWVILAGHRQVPSGDELADFAETLRREVARLDAGLAESCAIGVGAPQTEVADAFVTVRQAAVMARTARRTGEPIAVWDREPAEALLGAVLAGDPRLIPESLARLSREHPPETLDLVASYLERAGDVPTVAAELHLHRATVYQRVRRFERASGFDLGDGSVRFLLQLWFRARDRFPE